MSCLCYTSWPGFQAVDGGRDRPRLGVTLSDGTNRIQAQILILTAALQTAERRARQVYTSGGGWARDHLKAGAAMAALPQTGVTSWPTWWVPMGGQNQRENHTPLSKSRRNIAYAQGGAGLSHCEATNPRRQRHHRPAGRRAKRALADHFTGQTGRRCTVNPC